jgi:RimJ/RimL family protein N-acetyltransferase
MIETPRLILRSWRDSDRDPFARMNADPRVMEFFPACLSREESDALFDRARLSVRAAELRETGDFIGFIGLSVPTFEAHFTPCVEIGWRLAAEHWGRGLATEGAQAVLATAVGPIVSFTSVQNVRSRRVMEKIGLTHDPADDFDHPRLPAGHPLRRHVLYRGAKLR